MATVTVPVKSAWESKIIWTQVVAVVAMFGTLFGIDLPPELQAEIVGGIVLLQGGVTFVLKKYFTNTITPASVPPTAITE